MTISIPRIPQIRGRDAHGAGYFGASRAGRIHQGVDFIAQPGSPVLAFFPGKVTKLGQVYAQADKAHFRYVEVQDARGHRARYFYVQPLVAVGDEVRADDNLGVVQELPYKGITPHYHFEVKRGEEYLDPLKYLCGDA